MKDSQSVVGNLFPSLPLMGVYLSRRGRLRTRAYYLTLLFVLVAAFIPNKVWAQCTYISQSTATSIDTKSPGTLIYETGTFTNDAGISKIEFQYKKSSKTLGMSDVSLEYCYNGTWTQFSTYSLSSSYEPVSITDFSSHPNMVKATAFRVYTSGKKTISSYTYYVQNFKVYVKSSLSISPQEVDFGTVPVGSSKSETVTLYYSNIGTTLSSSELSAPYSISIPTTIDDECPAGGLGTMSATITYAPMTNSLKDEQTITISASNGMSQTITLIGIASSSPTHDWKGESTYKVDDAIDLSSAWISNSAGNRSFSIVHFTADNDGEIGAAAPAISGATLTLGQAGTLTIRMTQEANAGYNAKTSEQTIRIIKRTPVFTWSSDVVYYNTNYPFYFVSSQNETALQYNSSDEDVAQFADGGLTVYNKQGSTTLTATQAENYKWNAHTEARTITPQHVDNHLPITITAENMEALKVGANGHKGWNNGGVQLGDGSGGFNWDDKYYIFTFSGIPNRISFNYEVTSETATGFTWYVAVSTNQTDWEQIWDVNSQSGSADIAIDNHDIRYIKLCYSGNFGGIFKDVHISEYKAFSASPLSVDFESNVMGQPCASKTVTLTYANIGYKVTASINDPHFTVSPTYVTSLGGEKYGTQEFTISYSTTEEHTSNGALLTLTDELGNSSTVSLSGKTVGKLATHIEYKGQASYDQGAGTQPNPFRVIDANGNEVVGAKITMVSSKIAVLSVSEDGVSSFTPSCGGNVILTATYAGDEAHKPSSLSQTIFVEKCTHHIEWQQSLMGFTATPEGSIDETVLLTAKAVNDNGTATNIPITYTIDDPSIATLKNNDDGTYSVHVTAVGETTITATTAEDDTYATESVTHSIRVRKEGEACHSYAIEHTGGLSMLRGGTTDELTINGLPDQLTFEAKRQTGAAFGDGIAIQYYDGSNWQQLGDKVEITGSWASYGPYTVPETAKRLRFKGSGSLSRYVQNIFVTQQTYLRTDITSISISDKVHNPFSQSFNVSYSDIPVIQYSIECTNPNITLALTTDRPVNNNCGEYGTYTFTLSGSSNFPANYSGTIHLLTSAGDAIDIPFAIEITLNGTFYFDKEAAAWETSNKWKYGYNYDHKLLPDGAAEAVISKPVTLNSHAEVYALTIEGEGMLTIEENGGLTVYEGGITIKNTSSIHLISNHSGAGYLRISPSSTMSSAPAVTTHYTTRSTLSTGANKDATWQYVGAPGDNCIITTDGSQWLYLWDEQNGWVRKSGTLTLTPFAGYAITQYGQPTYEWTSTMILGNQDIVLTKTAGGMDGENVFVNSYTAPIDVKCFTAEDFEGDMDKTFYLFNAGSWNQWNAGEADGTNLGKNGDDTPGHYCAIPALAASYIDPAYDITTIPPMQGVYVKTNADGAVIHLNYEKHVWKATDSNLNRPMRKAELNEEEFISAFSRIRIQANSNNSGADRIYVVEDTIFSRDYDNGYDAPKEIADGLMNLYVREDFGQTEMSCTDRMDSTTIGFLAGEDNEYRLRISSIIGEQPIYLKDNESMICVEVSDGYEYHFTATPFSNNPERFLLLRTPTSISDGPTTQTTDSQIQSHRKVQKILRNGHLYVSDGEQQYDILGRKYY